MSWQATEWALKHSRATGTTRCVLLAIAYHVGADGEGWAYVDQLCREANCSLDSYYRAVRWAEANGELVRDVNAGAPRARADKKPNVFRLKMTAPADCPPRQPAAPADCGGRGPRRLPTPAPARPPQIAGAEKSVTTEKSLGAVCFRAPSFDEFYAAYPKHKGKGAAKKAWDRAVKRAPPDAIVAAAAQFATERNGHDPQFTPYPATWLNQDRWCDEPDEPSVSREVAGVLSWANNAASRNGRLL